MLNWHPDLLWFRDSPDAGHPTCQCSWCGIQITPADEGPRLWWGHGELRFHLACWEWVATRERLLREAPEGPGADWPQTVQQLEAYWEEEEPHA